VDHSHNEAKKPISTGQEEIMGKVEGVIKSEIIRLAKKEVRKISLPLGRDVRVLKSIVFRIRKTVQGLERFATQQQVRLEQEKIKLEVSPEEIKVSRFSPRLIRSLRKRLGITQDDLATLAGVTVGAVHQWESGHFQPREEKKGVLVALRKHGRREVRDLLAQKKKESQPPKKTTRRRRPAKKSKAR
jgi:DNA-binding transcriptional regulator YiaG